MASGYEQKFNIVLARLLREQGLQAEAEVKQPEGRRLDVLVDVDGSRVVLEGEIGNRHGALGDAYARLEQGLADAAIAICYPEIQEPERDLREVEAAPVDGEWRRTDMAGLSSLVRTAATEVGDIEETAHKFRAGLEVAADRLTTDMIADAVRVSNIPVPTKEDIKKDRKAKDHPKLRLALLVASAAMFHANLDRLERFPRPRTDARTGTPYKGEWPPAKLKICVGAGNCPEALTAAWETILASDYKPVFESAVNVLNALPPGTETHRFAQLAARAGLWAAGSLGGRRHDLLGRVFHWIVKHAANTGAFYTSDAAATLLAGLAIRPSDADRFYNLTVVDPACGTGTLLMAVAKRLEHLTPDARGEVGGRHLIEKVLHGYDIEAAAIQMAAVALGLLNFRVTFERMGIHQPLYGTDDVGTGIAGSLEFYGERAAVSLYTPVSKQVETGQEKVLTAVRHDLVIMNPPFTRDSLRHDHLGDKQEKAVKAREAELFKGAPAGPRHSGGMFLLLADRLCDKEDGTVALVYPTASCGALSARPVWERLLENFHLETVITSHDPRRIYFSENTSISECLFVLRRLNKDNRNQPTFFINLKSNPAKASDAVAVADDIRSGDIKGVPWEWERVERNDWTPVKFLSPYLVQTTAEWFTDGLLGCVALGDLAEVGPAGRRTQDAYERGDIAEADEYGRWGLWFNNQEGPATNGALPKQTMQVRPDCSLLRKPNTKKRKLADLADKYWGQAGRLLMPIQFRPSVARTFAVRSIEPVLGSSWVPARHRKPFAPDLWEMAMCVYLNSTMGILAQIWVSTPKVFGRPAMSLSDMRNVPVPDLEEAQVAALADHFQRVADRPLLRLRDQEGDLVRASLDEMVCETMGWDREEIEKARFALAAEPSVTGQPARN